MKQVYTKPVLALLLIVIVMVFPMIASAQFDPFPDNGNPDAPIDGGLSLLVAAGVGYGAKKLKEKRDGNNTEKKDV